MSRKRFISSDFYRRHGAATLSSRRWLEDRRHSDRFVNYYKIQKQKVTTIYFYLPFGTLLGFLSQDMFLSTISNSEARGDNGFLKGLTLDSQLGVQAAQADPNCSLFKVWLACQKTAHRFTGAISSTVTRSWALIPAGSLLVPPRKSRLAKTSKLQEVVKLKRSRTAWREESWTSAGIPQWQSRYVHLGPAVIETEWKV